MWIEDELKKDANDIQRSVRDMASDYNAKLSRTIRTRISENKGNTTDFFNDFYENLRKEEYEMYKRFSVSNDTNVKNLVMNVGNALTHEVSEIKNSANDLPHPRILSELQRDYDTRNGRQHHHRDTDADSDADPERNRYIPYKVYRYIREKSEYCIMFKANIYGRDVSLYFITFPESHIAICSKMKHGPMSSASYLCASEIAIYQIYAYKVFIWISIISRLANKECSEKLDVYFYMTPFKKERPTIHHNNTSDDTVLSAIHVNTGLTRNCETHGEIIVYRTEEWFKVFIHESMHNFNIDFIDLDLRLANQELRKTFCIPHDDILLFETYTETWARIINVMFETYFHKEPSGTSSISRSSDSRMNFIRGVREKLANNAFFHVFQLVKVLDIMKLKYSQITVLTPENMSVCRKQYAEDTNVYAYYILGGILSAYALPFISWCCDNNKGGRGKEHTGRDNIKAIRFAMSNHNLNEFIELIRNAARDPVLLNLIDFTETSMSGHNTKINSTLKRTMRMTSE